MKSGDAMQKCAAIVICSALGLIFLYLVLAKLHLLAPGGYPDIFNY